MAVKYLSDEWAQEVTARLRASEAVTGAARGQSATIQQVITDAPGGEAQMYLKLDAGVPEVGIGEIEGPEATITQTYETSVAIDAGELNPQAAFLQGKLKIQGNLMKLMQLQGFLGTIGPALKDLEREY